MEELGLSSYPHPLSESEKHLVSFLGYQVQLPCSKPGSQRYFKQSVLFVASYWNLGVKFTFRCCTVCFESISVDLQMILKCPFETCWHVSELRSLICHWQNNHDWYDWRERRRLVDCPRKNWQKTGFILSVVYLPVVCDFPRFLSDHDYNRHYDMLLIIVPPNDDNHPQ